MLLKELFEKSEAETPDTLVDDIAFYCDHDDDLHKEYFLPAVDELKRKKSKKSMIFFFDQVSLCFRELLWQENT